MPQNQCTQEATLPQTWVPPHTVEEGVGNLRTQVHQILLRLSQNWRRLKSAHLCSQVELPETKKTTTKTTTQASGVTKRT